MLDGLFMPSHLLVLGLIALLLFGAKRLPELGRQLGSGLRGVRESAGEYGLHELQELRDSVNGELRDTVRALPSAAADQPPMSPTPKV